MSDIFRLIILAIVQGITEFLPISSSGHLVILRGILGMRESGAGLEIALHVGTLIAIIAFYWRFLSRMILDLFANDIAKRKSSISFLGIIIAASIPAGIVGIFLDEKIESAFGCPRFAAGMLIITGIILLSTLLAKKTEKAINLPRGLLIGISQAVAILPGISRSGATISTARALGIAPDECARFTFVLAIPAILGAALLELRKSASDILSVGNVVGIIVSAFVGFISLKILVRLLEGRKFWVFAPYCFAVAIVGLIFLIS